MAGHSLGSNRVKNMQSPLGVVGCPRGGYSSVKLRPFLTLYGCVTMAKLVVHGRFELF